MSKPGDFQNDQTGVRSNAGYPKDSAVVITRSVQMWAWANAIVMFIVVLMGALVTKTGSGEGCGRSWPMCHGNMLPDPTMESLIEYGHRLVSGIAGLLVFGLAVYAWRKLRGRSFIVARWSANVALFFTFLQAILGAMAVVWPQSPWVLALHFGFSLMAVASTYLFAAELRDHANGRVEQPSDMDRKLRWWLVSLWVYIYGVVYLGALVRHMKSTGGCVGWPTCNGVWLPQSDWSLATWIAFEHRLAAAWLMAFLILLLWLVRRLNLSELVYGYAKKAVLLCAAQVFSGALIVWTLSNGPLQLLTSMIHIFLICWLFIVVSTLTIRLFEKRPIG